MHRTPGRPPSRSALRRFALAMLIAAVAGVACAGGSAGGPPTDPRPVRTTGAGAAAAAPAVTLTAAPSPAATAAIAWYRPPPGATWQWQLSGDVNMDYDVDVYDVDLFDTPDAVLEALRAGGSRVVCYFSAGSHEDWRDDAGAFPTEAVGEPLGDWPGERWLDVRAPGVMAVLVARLDLARSRGCDAVEPDNVDGFANDTGFPLTERDQLTFNRALAEAAHARGLGVGLKNAPELMPALVDAFDFAVTEQCHEQDWCDDVAPFLAAGRPVFNAEYAHDHAAARTRAASSCDAARALGIATLVLPLELDDAFRVDCSARD